jgi:hypothetical protein
LHEFISVYVFIFIWIHRGYYPLALFLGLMMMMFTSIESQWSVLLLIFKTNRSSSFVLFYYSYFLNFRHSLNLRLSEGKAGSRSGASVRTCTVRFQMQTYPKKSLTDCKFSVITSSSFTLNLHCFISNRKELLSYNVGTFYNSADVQPWSQPSRQSSSQPPSKSVYCTRGRALKNSFHSSENHRGIRLALPMPLSSLEVHAIGRQGKLFIRSFLHPLGEGKATSD